jgi:sortase A
MVTEVAAEDIEEVDPGTPEEGEEPGPPPVPRHGPPAPSVVVVLLAIALVASVVAVFLAVFAFGLSGLQEQRSQHLLYAEFRGLLDPSSPVAPSIGGVIPQGTPVALITAPQAGLHDVVVVEGTSSGDLLDGPGHLPDTPLPGQRGESLLLGKSATAGSPFGKITGLRRGDVIEVRTGQGAFRFTVIDRRVVGDRLPKIPGGGALLTLVTSAGSGGLGRLGPTHLVYVDARLDGKTVVAPPHRPTTVPPDEIQGHNDPAAWPYVGLWLLALVVATVAGWRLWARLGILRTWLIGAPVLFGILWGLSNEAMRLLPNVY